MTRQSLSKRRAATGFSLIELMVALVIVGILVAVAYPSYQRYLVRNTRVAAQIQVSQLSSMQENIFLNSNAYSGNMTTPYDGTANGGLGVTSGGTDDGKYTLTVVSAGQSYTITATPVAGTSQASDGAFSIASTGARTCGAPTPSWCTNGVW